MKRQIKLKSFLIPITAVLIVLATGITAVAVKQPVLLKKLTEPKSSGSDTAIVHYYNSNNWSKVNLYYYQEKKTTPKWPGVEMQQESGNWFGYEIKGLDSPRVIFSNNGNSQDPAVNKEGYLVSGEMWYKNGKWYDACPLDTMVNFCKPSGWSTPNIYYYRTSSDTGPAWPGERMTDSGNGWYTYNISKYSEAKVLFNDGVHQLPASGEEGFTVHGKMWVKDGKIYNYDPDAMGTNSTIGDINADGLIDMYDYNLLKSYIDGDEALTEKQIQLADTNNDGKADNTDLMLMDDYIKGIITVFPTDSDSDTSTETDSEINTDSESDSDINSDSESDSDTNTDSEINTDSDFDSDSNTDTDSEINTDSDVESDTDSDTESDTDSDTDSGLELKNKKASYVYDKLGRVTKVIYDSDSYVEYTYDANGNITNVNAVGNVGE